ncbi:hypothetical protein ACLQ3C_19610 [Gordonia sp. DT30]|uniref:hypothetical protein n=1 Tax=Gordonia sp. DT30 TaxID=3416546 RepID=UPI003CF08953
MKFRTSRRIIAPGAALAVSALMVLVLAALTAAVVMAASALADHRTVADNRDTLRAQAAGIVATVFSVDAADWQADRARSRSLVAADFAGSFAAQLRRAPATGTAAIRWRPDSVAVIDAGTDDGDVLVRASVVTRADGGQETTDHLTLRAGFVLAEGHWLLRSAEVLQ